MTEREYDPAEDARKCYEVAIAAKKARGDTTYPQRPSTPKQDERAA